MGDLHSLVITIVDPDVGEKGESMCPGVREITIV